VVAVDEADVVVVEVVVVEVVVVKVVVVKVVEGFGRSVVVVGVGADRDAVGRVDGGGETAATVVEVLVELPVVTLVDGPTAALPADLSPSSGMPIEDARYRVDEARDLRALGFSNPGEVREAVPECLCLDQAALRQGAAESDVLLAHGHGLGKPEVVDLQTPRHDAVRRRRLVPHQAVPPSIGKDSRRLGHTLRVVAEPLVEHRGLADGSVDEIGFAPIGIIEGGDTGLDRPLRLRRKASRDGGANGLAADHEYLVLAQDGGGRPHRMVERLPVHGAEPKAR
jgi:hypothetical protein